MVMGKAEYPFIGYNLYKIWHNNEGRWYAVLTPDGTVPDLTRTTVSWAKYLVCVKEGRLLQPDEEVDHIDNDRTNDSIENLQILSRAENLNKQARLRGKQMVCMRCPNCGRLFCRDIFNTHIKKPGQTYTACSRSCATTFAALMQYHPDDPKIAFGIQNNIYLRYILHKDYI